MGPIGEQGVGSGEDYEEEDPMAFMNQAAGMDQPEEWLDWHSLKAQMAEEGAHDDVEINVGEVHDEL